MTISLTCEPILAVSTELRGQGLGEGGDVVLDIDMSGTTFILLGVRGV